MAKYDVVFGVNMNGPIIGEPSASQPLNTQGSTSGPAGVPFPTCLSTGIDAKALSINNYVKQATSVPSVSGLTLREREMVQLLAEVAATDQLRGCWRSVPRLREEIASRS
jgi:hypothetical protein